MTACLAAWWWAGNIGAASLTGQLGGVFVPLGGGAAVFFVVAWAGKVATARELTKLWGRTKR
jgi:hypothetical protein